MKKCIMTLFAHTDDMEIYAAGTVAEYMKDGYKPVCVIATNSNGGFCIGDNGQATYRSSAALVPVRTEEVRAAAAVLGIEPILLNFKEIAYTTQDGRRVYADIRAFDLGEPWPAGREPVVVASRMPERIAEIESLMTEHEPELVLTHAPDQNVDHYATFLLARLAFEAAAKKVKLGALYIARDSHPQFQLEWDFSVDITDTIAIKLDALSKHETQCRHTQRIEKLRSRCREWGQSVGVEYAEMFSTVVRG